MTRVEWDFLVVDYFGTRNYYNTMKGALYNNMKTPQEIFAEAKASSDSAVDEFVEKHGEPMYCGFANVLIRPARGPFVAWLKSNDIGSNGYNGGWRVPWHKISEGHKNSYTQSMDIKETGCEAFADVLEKYGMKAYMQSRAD